MPTAVLILLLKGYTRETDTIPKCRTAEGWITASRLQCFKHSITRAVLYKNVCFSNCLVNYSGQTILGLWEGAFDGKCQTHFFCLNCSTQLAQFTSMGLKALGTVSFGNKINLHHQNEKEILKCWPSRYNGKCLWGQCVTWCLVKSCLIRTKFKYSA